MKLKGKTVKRLKKNIKEKMQKTLDRMTKSRKKDNRFLRDTIKNKLEWAKIERKKGLSQITNIKNQVLKLEGIILFCEDILNPKEEN